jgi:hypothetical protein
MRAWIESRRDQRASVFLFLIALLCYVYFFPRWSDPNQNSRLNMVVAIVDDGTFQIDKYVANTVDYAKVDGHYYSDKAPGAALLGVPVYAALKWALQLPVLEPLTQRLTNSAAFESTLRTDGSGVSADKVRFALAQVVLSFFTNALPSALTVVLLFRLMGSVTPAVPARAAVAVSYGLLSPAFAYANAFYGHQLSAFLLFAAFYILATRSGPNMRGFQAALAGLCAGYAVVTEFPALLIASVLVLFALWRIWQSGELSLAAPFLLGVFICAAGLMLYNNAIFGGPFKLGYSNSELWTQQHSSGFFSLTRPNTEALWGISLSQYRGLLLLSPALAFALPGLLVWLWSGVGRAECLVVLGATVLMVLFNASSTMWWGGFAVGPRYLLPALPFFAMGMVFMLTEDKPPALKLLLGAAMVFSFVAVWGLTLADQAFPSDTIKNPLLEYALPNWQGGNIARNIGTLIGLKGIDSVVPLLGTVAFLLLLWLGFSNVKLRARRY